MKSKTLLRRALAFFRYSLRLYFAPITGAIRGILREYRRIDAERARQLRAMRE